MLKWNEQLQGKMKKWLIVMAVSSALTCYGQTNDLVLIPGVGITGRIEMGMTIDQIRSLNPDTKIEWSRDTELHKMQGWTNSEFSASIPSLKTDFWSPDEDYPPDSYSFDVWPNSGHIFEGSVEGKLQFCKGNRVTREAVIHAYGKPTVVITEAKELAPGKGFTQALAKGHAVSCKLASDHGDFESIRYPMGILFNFNSNFVTKIVITRKTKQAPSGTCSKTSTDE